MVKVSLKLGILAIGAISAISANGANSDLLVPMVMDQMAPMAHPIAIGTNDDHHWHQ